MYNATPLPHCLLQLDPAGHCGLDWGRLKPRFHPPLLGTGYLPLEPVDSQYGVSPESSLGATPSLVICSSFHSCRKQSRSQIYNSTSPKPTNVKHQDKTQSIKSPSQMKLEQQPGLGTTTHIQRARSWVWMGSMTETEPNANRISRNH